jgi:hypothetical protein
MKKKKKKSPRRYQPFIIGALALGAVIYFAISRLPKATPAPIGINEVSSIPATVTLSLPPTVTARQGSESSVDIMIQTGGAKVTAVQAELAYDPASISTPKIVQGDFLTDKLGTPKVKDGLITFVYIVPVQSQDGKSGEGKLATLKFTAKNANSQSALPAKPWSQPSVATQCPRLSHGTNIVTSTTSNPQSYNSRYSSCLADIAPPPYHLPPRKRL